MLIFEISVRKIHENREGWFVFDTAGFFEGKNSFHPALTFVALTAKTAFAPDDAKAQRPLGPVIGGLNAMFL